eukprot:COSAG06_NODE_8582_length_2124_cov_1.443951_4_plen_73_part_00
MQADSFTFGRSGRGTFAMKFSYHEILFITVSGALEGGGLAAADVKGFRLTSLGPRTGASTAETRFTYTAAAT